MRISNNESLKCAFFLLHFCDLSPEKKKDTRVKIKQYYKDSQNMNALQALNNDMEVKFYTGYTGYEGITKFYYLDNEPTEKELHDYRKNNQIHSPYDCTGLYFLSNIDTKKLHNGKTLITESWKLDI